MQDTIYIGVDGGGTKCRAVVSINGEIKGEGLGGGANPYQNLERTKSSIETASRLALEDAGLSAADLKNAVAGLGLAGVNIPGPYKAMKEWDHPFKEMFLTGDLHTACLGAHGGDGAIIVTGTGSCGYAMVNGKSLDIGGYGYPLGDQGGGAWLGLEIVKAALLSYDGLGPKTSLEEWVVGKLELRGSLIDVIERLQGQPSSEIAQLALGAFNAAKAGDEVAIKMIKEGTAYVDSLVERLRDFGAPRLTMVGGIGFLWREWMKPENVAFVSEAQQPPEVGAVYFAEQEYNALL